MKRKMRNCLRCVLLLVFAACGTRDEGVERALALAGENRMELEKVIEHYSQDAGDSLKLRAARFLIGNMPGHYTLEGNLINEYRKRIYGDTVASFYAKKALDISLGHLEFIRERSYPVEDVKRVTADFLIRHVDRSFERLEEYPWLRDLPFEVFLEHVLPYRFAHERLDLWVDSLRIKEEALADIRASGNMKHTLWNERSSVEVEGSSLAFSDPLVMELFKRYLLEDCFHIELRNLFAGRVSGLPVVLDCIPRYANRNGYHYWTFAFSPENRNTSVRGTLDRKAAKIYRFTYFRQNGLNPKEREFVPEFFQEPFYEDVSDEYMYTADVSVPTTGGVECDTRYAYLCVFNKSRWRPVCAGEFDRKGTGFERLGKNVVYLPVCYEDKKMVALNYPFVLDLRGECRYLEPDTTRRVSVRLERKYPFNSSLHAYNKRLGRVVVEASERRDFVGCDTVLSGLNVRPVYAEGKIDTVRACRYWRVVFPAETACAGGVCFDGQGERVRGSVDAVSAAGFDDDPLTNTGPYPSPVIDFGRPVSLSRIVCLPRGDGNGIYPGDEYELFYHDLSGWKSLGRKVAADYHVDFEGVPSGALLWLHNRTEGVEERVFTVEEDGEIRYW